MANIAVIYASMTGNTEEMAEAVAAGAREAGAAVDLENVMDVKAADLSAYDAIILGAYTWGDGELPDEFLDFYEELDGLELAGRPCAVFGSADSNYDLYGAAVDILLQKLEACGAVLAAEGLKVELNPSAQEQEACKALGQKVVEALNAVHA